MIAILAGRGQLPVDLYRSLVQKGLPFVVITCDSAAPTFAGAHTLSHHTQWGKVGALLDFLHKHKVKQIMLAGAVTRPQNISDLKFDWRGLQWVNSLRHVWQQGDDGLLRGVISLLEKEGFQVVSPHDYLDKTTHVSTALKPSAAQLRSIEIGRSILLALSPFDVGQSVVVAGERVLGIEGPEGTDALIHRCAAFVGNEGGVLIKMAKIGQSLAVDKPTLGSQTILKLAESGLKGVAFEQTTTHIIDCELMLSLADKQTIFVHSFGS